MRTIVCGRWNKYSSVRPEARQLWVARNRYDSGKTVLQDVKEAEDSVIALLLRELEEAGVSMVDDGGIRLDSIYDVLRQIPGCEGFNQLTRIPETNHFHRQPFVESNALTIKGSGPLQSTGASVLARDLAFARARTTLPVVISFPGPYSSARQTENVSEIGLEPLARFYAWHLYREIRLLLEAGAAMVRIEEPLILSHSEDAALFQALMRELTYGVDQSRVALAAWFEDISKIPDYFNLPFGIFFVDFVDGVKNIEILREFPSGKQLAAGIFDARQTYEESREELWEKLSEIFHYVPMNRLMLSCNTDLDFLPWDEALSKVRRMVAFAKEATMGNFSTNMSFSTEPESPRFNTGSQKEKEVPIFIRKSRKKSGEMPSAKTQNGFGAFPTSTVGSFPQPEELRKARALLRQKKIDQGTYRELVARHTRDWLNFQEELQITVPVSGEFIREDMAAYFGLHFGGRLLDFIPSYENRRYRPVEYFKKIRFENTDELADEFRFVQQFTARPVKETITGPATLADWALIKNARYYKDRRAFRMDLARTLRQQIDGLVRLGVRVLQVDEPALTTKWNSLSCDLEAIHETIRGLEDNVYLILHICYSDMEALGEAFPYILELPFHQIHMEMANRNYSLMRLIEKYGFGGKDIGLGVIDVHNDRVETVEEIVVGVERALQYFDPNQIWLTPDCGLKERSDEVAKQKLRNMARAAEICRKTMQ